MSGADLGNNSGLNENRVCRFHLDKGRKTEIGDLGLVPKQVVTQSSASSVADDGVYGKDDEIIRGDRVLAAVHDVRMRIDMVSISTTFP